MQYKYKYFLLFIILLCREGLYVCECVCVCVGGVIAFWLSYRPAFPQLHIKLIVRGSALEHRMQSYDNKHLNLLVTR